MNSIVVDDEAISRKLTEHFILKTDSLQLLQSFSEPINALSFLMENKVDVIFLDIDMPQMSGMDFVSALQNQHPQIILITSHENYALKAFEYDVTDYLVKPMNYQRFYKAVCKANKQFIKKEQANAEADVVFVKKGNSIVKLRINEIRWVEALGDYIVLYTEQGKFIINTTMKAIEEKLPTANYARVHRSYIVCIDHIDHIEDRTVFFGNKLIPIGKSYKDDFMRKLNIL